MQTLEQHIFDALKRQCASEALYSTSVPNSNIASAYKLQSTVNTQLVATGEKLIGWKAGLTNHKAQQTFGVTHPVYAPLFARGLFTNTTVPHPSPLPTHLEGEVALRFGHDCPDHIEHVDQLLSYIDSVHFGFEIVSRRLLNSKALVDLIADNLAATGCLISEHSFSPDAFHFSDCKMELIGPTDNTATGTSANVMSNPLIPVLGLIKHLQQHNQQITKGDLVLSGAMVIATNVQPGDHFRLQCFQGNEQVDAIELLFEPQS